MDEELKREIDNLITERIIMYHKGLIKWGQIPEVSRNPTANPLVSHCTQSDHTPLDELQEDPVPPRSGFPL